ncbi:EAL domain-containing protein [Methylobacterium sp. BTF04]|uniref:bifunctional diguanylate cyclase/phosphodiesterase n=1 Tax=Methylobacterium sp. BTF04 TaxID=2708300 RepID=UPI001FEEFF0B|nr:EAL domain-containing protein [Methylobacterium sp. BTF04]
MRPRSLSLLVLSSVLLAVLIAVSAAAFIVDLHDRAIDDSERNLISLSTVLADQADRALQAIELVQEAVIEEIRLAEIVDEEHFIAQISTLAMHQALKARTSALPQVNAITLVDQTGKLRNFTRYWPIPDVSIADRDYFKAIVADHAMQRIVSQPVENRGDGTWTIYIARKISGPDGKFLGLVLGAVELQYFTKLYRQIAPAPDYVISMFRNDGVLLVRHPHRDGTIGRGFQRAGASLITARGASGGVLRNVSPIDSQDRLIAARSLANYPAILSVSRTAAASLAQWWRQATVLGAAAVSLDLGLLGLVILGVRQARSQEDLLRANTAQAAAEERERGERDLRTQYARFGIALNNMTQGLCLFDGDDRLIVMNARFVGMHAIPTALHRRGTARADIRAHLAIQGGATSGAWPFHLREATDAGSQSEALASFTWDLADGRAIGVVYAEIPGGGWLCTHEDVTDRARSEAQIVHMARHDALTGLPNRAYLRERMEAVLASRPRGQGGAVLYLDLDGFKMVNDTFGHPAGDELLRHVAHRLHVAKHDTDFVARLGGDEFAIVQSCPDQPMAASVLAARVVEMLEAPFTIQGQEIVIGTSIGIATAEQTGVTSDTLLRRADVALYEAKAAGRGTWRFFDLAMDAAIQRRHHLALDMRFALAEGQFELHYQPVVETRTHALRGFEALLRWHHPEHGLVSPAEFIPLAEETGLIKAMGAWALAKACADATCWPDPIKVAVNLSSVQFVRGNLVDEVQQALAASGLAASRLELEITESVLLRDNDETFAVLHQLRALGLQISMDDFGTGYSSVSYLRRFPFDKLKIDQCFIRNLERDDGSIAIVRAMIGLGKALAMNVIAEGVETVEQASILQAEGCDELQGYLFSKPLPLLATPGIIERHAFAAAKADCEGVPDQPRRHAVHRAA